MPYNKAQTLLLLYLDLEKEDQLRSEVLKRYNITERTLRRYLTDLRNLGFSIKSEPVQKLNGVPVIYPESYIKMEKK